ncbi:MAG TPA: NADPH dehydrogenase NamA, partial [Chitinophagaceae bacterium]|nr:NADPH dehydrogenase NamA [Chitinophagaceae bacterium]
MSRLFEPFAIKTITLRNRIVVSPMCQYSSTDGFANDWHLVHLGSRAVGGAGLVLVEATAVSPEGRITPGDLGLWSDAHTEPLKRIVQFMQAQGAVAGIQLAHAGRKASHQSPWNGGAALQNPGECWQTVAPSAIAFKEGEPLPQALTEAGIEKVLDDFKQAAKRAVAAGFHVVEIHAAHGYLIHQFLSPLSNKRTDNFGGSFENRIRFLLKIIEGVQAVWPATFPLFVRISASDWIDGGWTIDDSVALAAILKEKGVDLIDCSSGGNSASAKIPVAPLYQTGFAARIKKEAGILTGAVGLITTETEAEDILQNNEADLIFLARQLLRDPYFPLRAAAALGDAVTWPVQYERAKWRT